MGMGTAPASQYESATSATGRGAGEQFVTFHIDEELFAVPLGEVQEIIRMPPLVHVPLSPSTLEGIANLRGSVMSVTSLRRVFQYRDIEHDDATRVVVLNRGVPVGLVVDRMAAVVSVQSEQIEPVGAIDSTLRTDLLRGVIRQSDAHRMIMILEAQSLTSAVPERGPPASARAGGAAETRAGDMRGAAVDGAQDELQLVSFEVAGQEYALPIEHVQEIVQLPSRISRVPRTDAHVLGLITLRDRLLPLVNLRSMFGLEDAEPNERNKIVVAPLPGGASVGIVMDMVREVLRVSRSRMDAVPGLLEGGGGAFAGICRLDGGKRLVTVLSAEALFASDTMRRAALAGAAQAADQDMAGTEGTEMAQRQDEPEEADGEEQFVVFRLADEEYGAPIAAVQEIVRVPEEITRLPRAPSFIRGVVNLRGAVLPVVDQRSRFALPEIARSDRQRIMVFTIGGTRTGFIIDSVSEVLKIPRRAMGPAPALAGDTARLISRVANLEGQKRMILLIAVDELLAGDEHHAVADAAGVTQH